jgi:GTPase
VIGVQLPDVSDGEHASSLDELTRLATTLGLEVIGRIVQKKSSLAKAGVLGRGKLKELARYTGGSGVVPSGAPEVKRKRPYGGVEDEEPEDEDDSDEDEGEDGDALPVERRAGVVLVDHDLSPTQARNLERATSAEVMDRTSVILAIFHRHARSREAKLQVEIARLKYLTPRLREVGGGGDRQRGGIGGRGAGESALELDRRKVRDRIAELRRELESIGESSQTRRSKRSDLPTVALVGYTNAGKSSLMRALTGSSVYVADALFATLDTTVRALHPETKPRILVTDTVGFIKKLPHDLVASFRSTLDEAASANLLLHIVDASDPAFHQQLEVTKEVLAEIGADGPSMLVLNKIDRVVELDRARLAKTFPDAIQLSAHDPSDVARLREVIVAHFEREMIDAEIFVPYSEQQRVSAIYDRCRVLSEHHDENGTTLKVRAPSEVVTGLRR